MREVLSRGCVNSCTVSAGHTLSSQHNTRPQASQRQYECKQDLHEKSQWPLVTKTSCGIPVTACLYVSDFSWCIHVCLIHGFVIKITTANQCYYAIFFFGLTLIQRDRHECQRCTPGNYWSVTLQLTSVFHPLNPHHVVFWLSLQIGLTVQ